MPIQMIAITVMHQGKPIMSTRTPPIDGPMKSLGTKITTFVVFMSLISKDGKLLFVKENTYYV